MIEIPVLVTSVWTALQPYLPIIATKGAEEIGKTVVTEVWTAIKNKFDHEEHTKKVIVKLLKDPQNADVQAAFRVALQDILEEDQSFATDLGKLLEATGSDYKAQVIGNGASAQGNRSIALGKNAIHIGGSVSGSNIITGNGNTVSNSSTPVEQEKDKKK